MKIFPVIHLKDYDNIDWRNNLEIIFSGQIQADGVFFISMNGHDFYCESIAPLAKKLYPHKLIGINLLTGSAIRALRISKNLGLDMTWSDDPGITSTTIVEDAKSISNEIEDHMFFASIAFKYQRPEPDPVKAAQNAAGLNLIATTSGTATGIAASLDKIQIIKNGLGDKPLALASGLDPKNISTYAPLIEYALVSTGISKDFYNFDEKLFKEFVINSKI